MRHNVIAVCLLCFGFFSNPASAGIMLSFYDVPTSYTPGEDFAFQVRLEGVTNLNSYFIELRIRADRGAPSVDFSLNADLTRPPLSRYLFGEDDSLFDFLANSVVEDDDLIVSLSGFLLVPGDEVDVISDANDLVATVVISTTRNVGNLTIEFDTTFLELVDADFEPVPGLDSEISLGSLVVSPTQTAVIPEPHSRLLWLIAFLSILGAGRRRWFAHSEAESFAT